jgi:hypothetical protein
MRLFDKMKKAPGALLGGILADFRVWFKGFS